jgi:hypothetical protein
MLETVSDDDLRTYKLFNNRLLKAIEQDSRTPRELARDSWVQTNTIIWWINGRRLVDIGKLVRIADNLCTSLDWLLSRKDNQRLWQK